MNTITNGGSKMEDNESLEKAISYCIENFSTKEATKRIVGFIINDRGITEALTIIKLKRKLNGKDN